MTLTDKVIKGHHFSQYDQVVEQVIVSKYEKSPEVNNKVIQ